jgi:teichuronic acid exporter
MERGGVYGIQFIVQIILARLLLPDDFGLIAIVLVFISLARVFVESSFNTALIQKKDASEVDFSSVFYLSLLVSGLLYLAMYFLSPFISGFFNYSQLTPVLRVLSLTLFFGAFNSIQIALVTRKFIFKKLFFSSLGSGIISGTAGIIAAYSGLGIWALVIYQLTNQMAISIILWLTIKWRPRLLFSYENIKVLFSYGWKILTSELINTLYVELRTLIIGKIYSPAMLGFYDRGKQSSKVVVQSLDNSIQTVMLAALAERQENWELVKSMMRRAMKTSSFIVFPMMIGLAVVAEPAVKIVLTDKWLPAVPFLQIFCLANMLRPVHTANLAAIKAIGRSDIFLRVEIVKKIIGLIILAISIPFGIYIIAWGVVLSTLIASFINAYPNSKLLNYKYLEQVKDSMPALFLSLIMGLVVYPIQFLDVNVVAILVLQVCCGIMVYLLLTRLFKMEAGNYIISTIKEMIRGQNR